MASNSFWFLIQPYHQALLRRTEYRPKTIQDSAHLCKSGVLDSAGAIEHSTALSSCLRHAFSPRAGSPQVELSFARLDYNAAELTALQIQMRMIGDDSSRILERVAAAPDSRSELAGPA